MDHFKLQLLRDLLQDAVTAVRRGETSYGTEQDDADATQALGEMLDELERTEKLGYEDSDTPLISHGL